MGFTRSARSHICNPARYVTLFINHRIVHVLIHIIAGELTDMHAAKDIVKSVSATGYGHMRIINYKKGGQVFRGDVTVFPVYDANTYTGDVPILTHFVSVLSNVEPITDNDVCNMSTAAFMSRGSSTGSTSSILSDSMNDASSSYSNASNEQTVLHRCISTKVVILLHYDIIHSITYQLPLYRCIRQRKRFTKWFLIRACLMC